MDGLSLLAEARSAGLAVAVDGDRLTIRGPRQAEAVARKLLDHKGVVLAVLAADQRIVRGDMREAGRQVADESVDLVFTDPPYLRHTMESYDWLGAFAARVLKPRAWCVAYCGQAHLPTAIDYLRRHLAWSWCFSCLHTNGTGLMLHWRIANCWKPILGFQKPPTGRVATNNEDGEILRDVASGGREKTHHEWQQPVREAVHYIGRLSPPGGLVVDPFAGSGSFGVAAKALGRRFLGIEVDPDTAAKAAGRLAGTEGNLFSLRAS